MKESGDTPTGNARVGDVIDHDPEGKFVNANGTPRENVNEPVPDELERTGRYFIPLIPESGDILNSGRTALGIHGGGSKLENHALDGDQPLVPTLGCPRASNRNTATLVSRIADATAAQRNFKVLIDNASRFPVSKMIPRSLGGR